MDLYKILGVAKAASIAEIKASYRKLALTLHPDVTGGDKSKADRFRQIQHAYQILSNEKEKFKYDESLGIRRVYDPHVWNRATSAAAAAAASARKQSASPPRYPPPPGGGIGFNTEVWNAWHYGDGIAEGKTVVQSAVRQKDKFTQGLHNNPHAAYFARKAREDLQRRAEEAMKASSSSSFSSSSSSYSSSPSSASERLRRSRDIRRSSGTGTATTANTRNDSVSPDRGDKGNGCAPS